MHEDEVGPAARDARRLLVQAQAALAEAALAYAESRRQQDAEDRSWRTGGAGLVRVRPGEFAADELAVMWCDNPWQVRRLLARCARVRSGLPSVWDAHRRGDVDADQLLVIDRAARRAAEDATRVQIDARAVDAARTRNPRQLASWLLRLVVECEPLQFAERHRRALSERRVTITQGPDGMGWVTGELSATDVAQIDTLLTALARNLGPADERTEQQRRADLMADLLLGRLQLLDQDEDVEGPAGGWSVGSSVGSSVRKGDRVEPDADGDSADPGAEEVVWVEVEDVDLDTGELLGTHLQPVSPEGDPLDPADLCGGVPSAPSGSATWLGARTVRRPQQVRIGVVVPLSSLLGLSRCPGAARRPVRRRARRGPSPDHRRGTRSGRRRG